MSTPQDTPAGLPALHRHLAEGTTTAARLAEQACAAAEAAGDVFLTVDRPGALQAAERSDARRASGEGRGPLDGIPVALKDVIDVAGLPTTQGSAQFRDWTAAEDAEIVRSLRQAGAVLVGKTNCHEISLGIRGDVGAFGVVPNPVDPARVAGGSSSGSAAAVAQGIVPVAVGTDTAGSVRVPAALCGVVGFKPTRGRISTEGVHLLAPSFDTVGWMATTVQDVRTAMQATGALGEGAPGEGREAGRPECTGLRWAALADVRAQVQDPVAGVPFDRLTRALDAEHTDLPEVDGEPVDFTALYQAIRSFESYQVHRHWLETTPERYQPATLDRLLAGRDITAAEVARCREQIERIQEQFLQAFAGTDVLISPTVPVVAPLLEEPDTDPARQLLRFTVPWNVLGWPAVSLPYRVAGEALPQSVQLIARPGEDALLLHAAEQAQTALAS